MSQNLREILFSQFLMEQTILVLSLYIEIILDVKTKFISKLNTQLQKIDHISWYIGMIYRSYVSGDIINIGLSVHKTTWPFLMYCFVHYSPIANPEKRYCHINSRGGILPVVPRIFRSMQHTHKIKDIITLSNKYYSPSQCWGFQFWLR